MVVHAFNLSTQEEEAGRQLPAQAKLVYIMSSSPEGYKLRLCRAPPLPRKIQTGIPMFSEA